MSVRGVEGKARNGSAADEGDGEEIRRSGGLPRYARPVEGDGGVGGLGRVVSNAEVAGRGGSPLVHDQCKDGRRWPARDAPQYVVGAQDGLVAPTSARYAVPQAHAPSADHGVDRLDQAGHEDLRLLRREEAALKVAAPRPHGGEVEVAAAATAAR